MRSTKGILSNVLILKYEKHEVLERVKIVYTPQTYRLIGKVWWLAINNNTQHLTVQTGSCSVVFYTFLCFTDPNLFSVTLIPVAIEYMYTFITTYKFQHNHEENMYERNTAYFDKAWHYDPFSNVVLAPFCCHNSHEIAAHSETFL